jgi:hypothetical protein
VAEEGDPGIDRQEVLREMEAAVFEPPRPVNPPPGTIEEPPPPESEPRPRFVLDVRRAATAGAALSLAGIGWLAAAMASKGWTASVLAAAFLTAGLLFLGRGCSSKLSDSKRRAK